MRPHAWWPTVDTCQLSRGRSPSSPRLHPVTVHCHEIGPFGHSLLSAATIRIDSDSLRVDLPVTAAGPQGPFSRSLSYGSSVFSVRKNSHARKHRKHSVISPPRKEDRRGNDGAARTGRKGHVRENSTGVCRSWRIGRDWCRRYPLVFSDPFQPRIPTPTASLNSCPGRRDELLPDALTYAAPSSRATRVFDRAWERFDPSAPLSRRATSTYRGDRIAGLYLSCFEREASRQYVV